MKTIVLTICLTVCFVFVFMAVSVATEKSQVLDGVEFDSTISVNDTTLKLKGLATLHYLIVIKAYTGGLYLPENVLPKDVLTDVPKRLELEYFHPITAEDFYDATEEMIKKNTTPVIFQEIGNELTLLSKAYKDVKPQDRYAITYWPGYGTELSLNGKLLETFKGAVFGKALFSIWLGEQPISEAFRNNLKGDNE